MLFCKRNVSPAALEFSAELFYSIVTSELHPLSIKRWELAPAAHYFGRTSLLAERTERVGNRLHDTLTSMILQAGS